MKRRLSNLAALLSLLIGLACLFMLVRSGLKDDRFWVVVPDRHEWTIQSHGGCLEFVHIKFPLAARPRTWGASWGGPWAFRWNWPNWPALQQNRWTDAIGRPWAHDCVVLPYWLLAAMLSILPAVWGWKRRQEKRQRGPRKRGFPVEARA